MGSNWVNLFLFIMCVWLYVNHFMRRNDFLINNQILEDLFHTNPDSNSIISVIKLDFDSDFKLIHFQNLNVKHNEYEEENKIRDSYAVFNMPSCPRIPANLTGYLNSTFMLRQANMTSSIKFYSQLSTNQTAPYQHSTNNIKNRTKHLSKTNNMILLNVSNHLYGHNGLRIQLGGYWKPEGCSSNFKVAIIIPYRDRLPHLSLCLFYLHTIMQRQMHEYRIFVIEPTSLMRQNFNKGRVMNAGFLEALRIDKSIDCFIFHDVDLVPEDDRISYSCPFTPRHLSVAIDKFNYTLPYDYLVGGVFAIKTTHYRYINGYSNIYWGWGGEGNSYLVK